MPNPVPLAEAQKKRPMKALIYGPPHAGKTAFATTFGEGAEVLDIGLGLQTAVTLKDKFFDTRQKIAVSTCADDDPAVPKAWDRLRNRLYEIGNLCAAKKYPFKCLIVDELTAMGSNAMRFVLFNSGNLPGPFKYHTPKAGITQPEWGVAMNEVLNSIIILRSLPIHVILVAHDVSEMEGDQVNRRTINVIGQKLTPQIPGYFDEVLYLNFDKNTKKRVLTSQGTYSVVARTRSQIPDNFDVDRGVRDMMKAGGYDVDLGAVSPATPS